MSLFNYLRKVKIIKNNYYLINQINIKDTLIKQLKKFISQLKLKRLKILNIKNNSRKTNKKYIIRNCKLI